MWLNYASFGASTIQVHHSSSSFKTAADPIDTLVYIPHSGDILGRLPATFVVLYSDDAAPRHNQAHSLFVILIEYQVKYIQMPIVNQGMPYVGMVCRTIAPVDMA